MLGETFHHYRILDRLGAGGMGEVYRARDERLGREVAVKALPEEMAADPERLRRLEAEARAMAAVDHPNVATIYAVEEHEGRVLLVLELVEGKTLAERLDQGPLQLEEALELARQVAAGLEAAHAQGIVHRDLKPGNVMLTSKGQVKILDFGLAKALEPPGVADQDLTRSPTLTMEAATERGVILGTAPYLSPEQARGQEIDARTDVWAFGCLLYEMLTGRRAFGGGTLTDTIAAVVTREPDWEALPDHTPAMVRWTLERCLHKDPDERLHSIADARLALVETSATGTSAKQSSAASASEARPGPRDTPSRRPRAARRLMLVTAGTVLLAAFAILLALWLQTREQQPGETSTADGVSTAAPSNPAPEMIAVLPFENLGSPDDESLILGLTLEITSRLSAVGDLGVISFSSAERFAQSGQSLDDIGEALGVDYLLEGTVQWAGGTSGPRRIRITPRLVRAGDQVQLWSQVFDEEPDDILRVQSEIAAKTIGQLAVALTAAERRAIEATPTEILGAYDAYLVGLYHREKFFHSDDHRPLAVESFERAVELDPSFALAWARLSDVRSMGYVIGWDRSQENAARAREAATVARSLAPDLAEAHLALANYHYGIERDYERAVAVLERVDTSLANRSEVVFFRGTVLRRQGRWQESIDASEEAMRLDPRSDRVANQLALTYLYLRDYAQALALAERAIALAPENSNAFLTKASATFNTSGDAGRARTIVEEAPSPRFSQRVTFAILDGDYELALDELGRLGNERFDDGWGVFYPLELARARVLDALGDDEAARADYRAAATVLESELEARSEDPTLHAALAIAHAGLGRAPDALRHGRRATELTPSSEDTLAGPVFEFVLARVLGRLGMPDAACEAIDEVLSKPGPAGVLRFERDPAFAPVRDEPCIRDVLAKYRKG